MAVEMINPRTGQVVRLHPNIARRLIHWLPADPTELTSDDAKACGGDIRAIVRGIVVQQPCDDATDELIVHRTKA